MKRDPWSKQEIALLAELFPHMRSEDVAALMGRSVSSIRNAANLAGLHKTPEFLKSDACGRMHAESQKAHRFTLGHKTWNAGMKGWSPSGSERGHFKPGSKPQTWKPIGTEKLNKDGLLVRKVADTGRRCGDWKAVHGLVWAAEKGPIPEGHIVIFKGGRRTADEALMRTDDMECLTRADLMRRNSYHRYPKEIAQIYQLRGALNRQIKKTTESTQ